jgi:hypothetical protein
MTTDAARKAVFNTQKRKTARELAAATPRRHTRSMTTDAAREAVFNTTELLDNVISFLPYTDILTKVQRFSSQWKKAVNSSPVIKSKLWMRFQGMGVVHPTHLTNEQTFPRSSDWGRHEIPIYPHKLKFNAILVASPVEAWHFAWRGESTFQWLDEDANGSDSNPPQSAAIDFFYQKSRDTHNHLATSTQSTWRDMYLTDPPISTALVHLVDYQASRPSNRPEFIKFALRDSGGLTLGLVHDTIMAALPIHAHRMIEITYFYIASLYVAFER